MAGRMFSPPIEALAYRLWGWAQPRGWNCSLMEAAEALDEPVVKVARVAALKGWKSRFRATEREIRRSHLDNGLREVDGIPVVGIDGLESLGVRHGL